MRKSIVFQNTDNRMGAILLPSKIKRDIRPVTLSGLILPEQIDDRREQEYKLACDSGLEYSILANSNWQRILSTFAWVEVKLIGILDLETMTIAPQKIYPKSPAGEKKVVIDLLRPTEKCTLSDAIEQMMSIFEPRWPEEG